MSVEYHRAGDGSTIVVEALYARRGARCASRHRCLRGENIRAGQPFAQVYSSEGRGDLSFHPECYIARFAIVGPA